MALGGLECSFESFARTFSFAYALTAFVALAAAFAVLAFAFVTALPFHRRAEPGIFIPTILCGVRMLPCSL
jgi:hypothetical protein